MREHNNSWLEVSDGETTGNVLTYKDVLIFVKHLQSPEPKFESLGNLQVNEYAVVTGRWVCFWLTVLPLNHLNTPCVSAVYRHKVGGFTALHLKCFWIP